MFAEIILWSGVGLLFAVGLAGTLIPLMPGILLILAGVLIFAFVNSFVAISVSTVVVITLLAILAWLADYFAGALGARVGGGGRYATIGAAIGGMLGFFFLFGPLGLLAGTFVGAFAGAIYEGTKLQQAHRVALFSILAATGAAIFQFFIGLVIIIAFFVAVFF